MSKSWTTNAYRYRAPRRESAWVQALRRTWFYGNRRYCNVCQSTARTFTQYGHIARADVRCPVCGCVERHRLTWRFFAERTDLFEPRGTLRMLHVAPEPAFEQRLRNLAHLDYLTVDAQDERVDMRVDLLGLPFADGAFDVIHCSHVLEHVPDDKSAMAELARVLAPGGWATILVPIFAHATFEDPTITAPAERARMYGQWDHVRVYGPDVEQRLAQAGFRVSRVTAAELVPDARQRERERLGDEQLFFCRKR